MEIQGLHEHLRGAGVSQETFYLRLPEASQGNGSSHMTTDTEQHIQLTQ